MDWNTRVEHSLEFINLMRKKAENKRAVAFGIFFNDQLCGVIDLHEWDHTLKKIEIGYWIGETFEGKGLVSASCRALIDYVFADLQLHKVEIRFALKNKRSSHIPIRLGFTKEFVLRQGTQLHGELVDMVIMGLLKEEWEHYKHVRACKRGK